MANACCVLRLAQRPDHDEHLPHTSADRFIVHARNKKHVFKTFCVRFVQRRLCELSRNRP